MLLGEPGNEVSIYYTTFTTHTVKQALSNFLLNKRGEILQLSSIVVGVEKTWHGMAAVEHVILQSICKIQCSPPQSFWFLAGSWDLFCRSGAVNCVNVVTTKHLAITFRFMDTFYQKCVFNESWVI